MSVATESMLVVAVVAVGTAAASYAFVPSFRGGVGATSSDVSRLLDGGWGGRYAESSDGTTSDSRFGLNRDGGANSGLGGVDGDGDLSGSLGEKLPTELRNMLQTAADNAFPEGMQACAAFTISGRLGMLPQEVYKEMFEGGFALRDGRTTLDKMQDYLRTKDHCSTQVKGATPAELAAAHEKGKPTPKVVVILDAKRNTKGDPVPATDCGGDCGHAMTFEGVAPDGRYIFRDDSGGYMYLTEAELNAIWGPHDRGFLDVPAKDRC